MIFKVDLCTMKYQQYLIDTEKLTLPSSDGRRTILSNHMPITISLKTGIIETCLDNKLSHFCVNGGVAYFEDNFAKVLSTNIVNVDEIDIDETTLLKEKTIEEVNSSTNQYRKKVAERKVEWLDCQIEAYKKYRL